MNGTCSKLRKMRNAYNILIENNYRKKELGKLDINGRILFKYILV
jgi:hypothetical protein